MLPVEAVLPWKGDQPPVAAGERTGGRREVWAAEAVGPGLIRLEEKEGSSPKTLASDGKSSGDSLKTK